MADTRRRRAQHEREVAGHVVARTDLGHLRLELLDASGRLVRTLVDRHLDAGTYNVRLDAADLPSGVYHYRVRSGSWVESGSVVLRRS